MVSAVLASVLQSYLGQYLELSDTSISVGSEVRLKNVRLKESALSELGLPVKCIHGKVGKLVLKIPWFNLFSKKTTIELEGLHLLVVPSSSVRYNAEKERKEQLDAKLQRLERIEEAKRLKEKADAKGDESSDTFAERLVANIIKNLEVSISRVHIRYEDKQSNTSGRYPFAAGITLNTLVMSTNEQNEPNDSSPDGIKLKVFGKNLVLDGFAVYWKPKAQMYSDLKSNDEAVDAMFDKNIGSRDNPVTKLKYLLGPICSTATMKWCPNPIIYDYKVPQIDLSIGMEELSLSLTKYQYQDFILLLQSIEYMSRSSKFRKYKARHCLENVPNYAGRFRDLWKFAFDCVYEEEAMRRINNWSWAHMREHVAQCKKYRELYKMKLTSTKLSEEVTKKLRKLEERLDEVNIRIQRQLAEREVEIQEKVAAETASTGVWGWLTGASKKASTENASNAGNNIKKFEEALSSSEKEKLYEIIDYQENAHHGIFPKSFVAKKLEFTLTRFVVNIRDDDLGDASVLKLELLSVTSHLAQRPSADYIWLDMNMENLTVFGIESKKEETPVIVATRAKERGVSLLNFSFENNPPSDPDGDLERDGGSLYDQRLRFLSSPLEVVYDAKTIRCLAKIFKTPDELNLASLQQSAIDKLKEYKATTTLGLQYVIDHHNLVDVDIQLQSSYIIIPHNGRLTSDCACAIANLGSITIKSTPISAETRSLKEMSLKDLTETFKRSLRDQAYDKFTVTLEEMQLIVALPNEEWRSHAQLKTSPLFLLKPTSLKFSLQYCLIRNDPEMPVAKVKGSLEEISINVSDYRLIQLAQIVDSLVDVEEQEAGALHRSDSNESMASALSSLANTGSFIMTSAAVTTVSDIIPRKKGADAVDSNSPDASLHMTQLTVDFKLGKVNLDLTQREKNGCGDQKLFHFTVVRLQAKVVARTFDLEGEVSLGGATCEHLLLNSPVDNKPVRIISTHSSVGTDANLLSVKYTDVKKTSPDFQTVHSSVLKNLQVKISSVHIILHQNAILDLIEKVNKFVEEVTSNAKRLLAVPVPAAVEHVPKSSTKSSRLEEESETSPSALKRQNARRLSRKVSVLAPTANLSRWAFRAKKRTLSLQQETVDVKVEAGLESVTFDFMTSAVHFATLRARDLQASYTQMKAKKSISAKLIDFSIYDSAANTCYGKIAESKDSRVFDALVTLYDVSAEDKVQSTDVVDVSVEAKMGRIQCVFLMKFIADFLKFVDPFAGAKEMLAETATLALEGATKSMLDAYANATRVHLDIQMDAPLIVIPVHSSSKSTIIADLGKLRLDNRFAVADGRIFDEMHFDMTSLQLMRAKMHDSNDNNEIVACSSIIKPITFELDIRRNMSGSRCKSDPPELAVAGTLYEINLGFSRGDYNVILAVLQNNFSEKGVFEASASPEQQKPVTLNLPLRSKHSGSRTSLGSGRSLQNLATAINVQERDPETKAVEFSFKFHGFEADIYSGDTPLLVMEEKRSAASALARFNVKLLGVDGHVLVDSSVVANAYLENCVLDDSRDHGKSAGENGSRITRLMEAKASSSCPEEHATRMIDIDFKRNASGDQDLEVIIHSFILVGSVPYLMEIANFFVLDQKMSYEWRSEKAVAAVEEQAQAGKTTVYVKIDEPDIFLVENIGDIDSDALVLNTELQFKFTAASDSMAIMASLTNIRSYTCRFNPVHREETMAEILKPCTLSFNISQNEAQRTRIHTNMSDLCLNVSPHSIAIIQKSIEAFVSSMTKETEGIDVAQKEEDHSDLWRTKDFKDEDFWFLKPEETMEATELIGTPGNRSWNDEQAIVQINNLVIKVESGVGTNTIPLLLLESSFNCDVRNWSSPRMSAIGSLDLVVAYYNSKLALWEPVIEPVCQVRPNGTTLQKRWNVNLTLQSNGSSDLGSALVSPSVDEADGFIIAETLPPLMQIALQSTEILEVTVTKTFLGVLTTLQQSFADVAGAGKKSLPVAPFIIRNRTGRRLTLLMESKKFKFFPRGSKPGEQTQVALESDHDAELYLTKDRSREQSEYVSPLQEQSEHEEALLRCRMEGLSATTFELPVSKADKRFFPFPFRGDEMGETQGMVSEISVDGGSKFVTLRSTIEIRNKFEGTVNVFKFDGKSKYSRLASLKPDATFYLPIRHVYDEPYEFHVQLEGEEQNMGLEAFNWRTLLLQPTLCQRIQCTNRRGTPDTFLSVEGEKEEIFLEKSGALASSSYTISIRPLIVFKNCLPVTMFFGMNGNAENMSYVEPGQSTHLQGVRIGSSKVTFKIFEFREADWECLVTIEDNIPELSVWHFNSKGRSGANGSSGSGANGSSPKLDLGVHSTLSHGTIIMSVYAPFWMVNKTGRMLAYKGQDEIITHPVELEDAPVMFSNSSRSFLGKKKASIRIDDSSWSDPFPLDTIEDEGKVTCRRPSSSPNAVAKKYSVGVHIAMSKSSLTKIITFTPYYLVLNTAEFAVTVKEQEGGSPVEVPAGKCVPFWPEFSCEKLVACVSGTKQFTPPFSMTTVHSTLLKLGNRFGAIHVDCRTSNSETLVTLSSYGRGLAPVQLVNASRRCKIEYWEKGSTSERLGLESGQTALYTWANPGGTRSLCWAIEGFREEYTNSLLKDGEDVIKLDDEEQYLAWVSFLDGMQRVVVFTDETQLCYNLANSTGKNERIAQEIDVSIFGVGISVVNNAPSCSYELLYVSVTSSEIVWEVRRAGKTRFKSLTRSQCAALEQDFQLYTREKAIGKRTSDLRVVAAGSGEKDLVVNYEENLMSQPMEGKLRRQFQKGVWLQMRSSPHQRQVHAKINRIQIDNQLRHCLFPVIMAPVPPPKSVLAQSIPKPFIELSVLEYMSPEHTSMRQFKYLHALVQELHIKIDQGLINALLELFEQDEPLDEKLDEFLIEDMTLAKKALKDIARLQVTRGQKDFFDDLHFSPLKVHVSFSLTSYKTSKATVQRSNFFNLFLQSLGVTITDTDDIIFRLAYFDRKHQFYSQQDLLGEMVHHYVSQAIKQAYVIVFGLDVIGNPFGLVVGVSRSIEDLFYEPFQGAVEGPSEFAEGLVIGVRSVFSGVVGGAAGTVSRITGALGKGLASLTFDDKFQAKRREGIKKRGHSVRENFARSGKGLVMGFVDGVTGVATKPIEGAKEEGVGGFFKGVGKGVVGLVARPTGGIIDFASGAFDSVKRVTEVTDDIQRVRPARYVRMDGVVRNYNLKEAEGFRILRELEKGRYAETDAYVTHEPIEADRNSVFMVTSKRVLFAVYNQMLGTWSADWEFELGAIVGPPPVAVDDDGRRWYFLIKPVEERKKVLGLFGGGESGKKVFMSNRETVRNLVRIIEDLRTSQSQC